MNKSIIIVTISFIALMTAVAGAGENLLEIWADIEVISLNKVYIDNHFKIDQIFGEITRLSSHRLSNVDEQKAAAYLERSSKQIALALNCPRDRQQTIDRAFLRSSHRPERMQVKIKVTRSNEELYQATIIDHRLALINDGYVYSPAIDPGDYLFAWCPDTSDADGIGTFVITDGPYFRQTGELLPLEPPSEIAELLRSLQMPQAGRCCYQYDAGTPDDISDDREKGSDLLISAGFEPAEELASIF